MNMAYYEPWGLLTQFHNEIDNLFTPTRLRANAGKTPAQTSDWTPTVDIKEETDHFVIHADIPGVDPKDIDIQMESGVLSIQGERQSVTQPEREGYRRIERVRGHFHRRFSLPDSANADAISARSQHGVLEVIIPKQQTIQPRRIEVAVDH